MHDLTTMAVTVFMGFFAMMNPIANTAVFVGMTGEQSAAQRKRTAFKALISAFFIISAFCLLGKAIFELFGITLPALRLAGGILVFLVGYHMLQGSSSKLHSHIPGEVDDDDDKDIAISPLALPILAGPGTIATAMNYSASGEVLNIIVTMCAFALLCVITFVCFLFGPKLIDKVGASGINITTRLMGLILTVIGMQMLIQGVHDAFTLFQHSAV
ncbi:MarC family protein [Agarivorans sp. TSD2052]|uniref:MarC family protein n=1 Tax=Agarivorans sp. TSD2052 TaxID=2937286 RepID=UPI00200E9574|nr:MarC family protein [Agarivorans sp. TSD2052]UPW19584.1 MarC family protein [Agarivorans sp. TSD2052]